MLTLRSTRIMAFATSIALMGAGLRDASAEEPPAAPAPERETLEGAKLDAVIADIAKARKELKSLRASFTQERRITLLAATVKSTGQLELQGDRLRWDLAPPDDIVYFVGPEGLAYKTKTSSASVPSTASGNGANVARALADLRALLSGDLSLLRARYALAGSRGPSDVEITGTVLPPNASDKANPPSKSAVRAFTLVLDKNLTTPVRARLIEGKSDSIDLKFSQAVLNAPIDPARLRP